MATATLSPALPFTTNAALLTFIPDVTLVMLNVGLVTSAKVTWSVRFDAIMNCTVALLVMTPPSQLVEIVQLVKTKPLAAVAVMA